MLAYYHSERFCRLFISPNSTTLLKTVKLLRSSSPFLNSGHLEDKRQKTQVITNFERYTKYPDFGSENGMVTVIER